MRVIGLMSGTSFDAIDAAALDVGIEGDSIVVTPRGMISSPYPDEVRTALAAALPPAQITMGAVCRLDTLVGQALASAAGRAVAELCAGQADLIASPGQTVFHWVEDNRVHGTLQIGQPAWIAERTGIPVVSDFRARDVAAGGQGAPLVSIIDVLWLRGRPGVPVALNLGGIANITVAAGSAEPVAFDTGPANALIDAAISDVTDGRLAFDADGARAARGHVHEPLLGRLLTEPYYALPAPKSTGKELFNLAYLRTAMAGLDPVAPDDLMATVTALTARTVADAVLAASATEVIVSGGGTRNPTLMTLLAGALGPVPVRTSDELGLPSAAKEAYTFAVLGFLTVHGLHGTVPSCTGARHPSVLGSLTPGHHPLHLPTPHAVTPARLRVVTA